MQPLVMGVENDTAAPSFCQQCIMGDYQASPDFEIIYKNETKMSRSGW
jgi:hypothetical protein